MNELDPNLKRLLKWAKEVSPTNTEDAPFGFTARVLASGKQNYPPTLLVELQEIAWGLTWVSLALIVCGVLMWVSQAPTPAPATELPSALSFLASNLTQ